MCENITFSDSTGLYYYSAWLQTNAALFAIVFIIAVYKLQSLQNYISEIKSGIIQGSTNYIDGELMRMFFDPKTRDKAIESEKDEYWKNELIVMKNSIEKRKDIRVRVKPLFILLPISLILNGALIIISSYLHKLGFWFELVPLFVILIFQIFLVIKLTIVTRNIFYRKSEI